MITPLIAQRNIKYEEDYILRAISIIKERITFHKEILSEGDYLFTSPKSYNEKTVNKKWKKESVSHLKSLAGEMKKMDNFSASSIEQLFHAYLQDNELGFGKIMPVLRLSITGKGMGPSMFLIMELLGLKESLIRVDVAMKKLGDG